MNPEQVKEYEDLTEAVKELMLVVRSLNDKLALYAPREEVRKDSRNRAFRFMGMSLVIIILAQLLTMMTISYCFLGATGETKPYCNMMPGYGEAVKQGEVRLDQFEVLVDTIQQNQRDIELLQRQINELKKEKG